MRMQVFGARIMWRAIPVVAAAALVIGCGGDASEELHLSVGAGAQFDSQAGPPRAVGYVLSVVFLQVSTNARPTCPTLPPTLQLLVDDQQVAPAIDPNSGCLNTNASFNLDPQMGTVTVDAKDGARTLAHAEFQGLTPGAGATLVAPADGQVRAGDEIIVLPTLDLPTGEASFVNFFPLDDATVAAQLYPPAPPVRLVDGLHVLVPAFTGRAAVTFGGMPYVPQLSYSCPGFDVCTADADTTLGPVFVTEGP